LIASKQGIDLGRASGVKSLRPFPSAACKVIGLISGDSVDYREVSQVLVADAAFSSQVLRVANSALLGARHEVKSIVQALSLMGMDRLRSLVVTVAVNNYTSHGDNAFLRCSWRHNLGAALWCEVLAEHCNVAKPLGYTAGMLHDIGRIALMMVFPNDYAKFLSDGVTGDLDRLEAERKFCDADHCQVGEYLAESWNFPAALVDVIAHHHDEVTRETPRLRLLVQAGCTAASMSGFATVGAESDWEPSRIVDMMPHGGDRLLPRCEDLLEKVVWKFNEIECSLL
jgi:HD-like signal output (HDOD) protein